jgi:hypothetical protein
MLKHANAKPCNNHVKQWNLYLSQRNQSERRNYLLLLDLYLRRCDKELDCLIHHLKRRNTYSEWIINM